MEIKTITKYIAVDGEEFATKEACLEHEKLYSFDLNKNVVLDSKLNPIVIDNGCYFGDLYENGFYYLFADKEQKKQFITLGNFLGYYSMMEDIDEEDECLYYYFDEDLDRMVAIEPTIQRLNNIKRKLDEEMRDNGIPGQLTFDELVIKEEE